jgi:ribosomal protein L37AE/L43A
MGLVDIELWDGTHTWCHGYREGLPWWRWGGAPRGLRTRSQVHAAGRRLARGQDPCGLIVWRRGKRTAALYRLDQTVPSRRKTPALLASVEAMERARRTCRDCGETYDYRMPTSTKTCWPCMEKADHGTTDRETTTDRTREGNSTMTEQNDTMNALIPDGYATAEEVWDDGYDHALALALHERTGWPIVGLECKNGGYVDHYLVRRPDGMLVDWQGAHTEDAVLEQWAEGTDYYSIKDRTVEAIQEAVDEGLDNDPADVWPLAQSVAADLTKSTDEPGPAEKKSGTASADTAAGEAGVEPPEPVNTAADGVSEAIAKARNAVEEITTEQAAGEELAEEDDRTDELARWRADDQGADAELDEPAISWS